MIFELTTAGLAAINATPGVPPVLSAAKLGSGYNYVPTDTDTDLHGTLLHTTTPSVAHTLNSNVLVYTIYLDPNSRR